MKRTVRIVAPVIAAIALTIALSASALAASPKIKATGPGYSIPEPVPAVAS